jgi:hypothetical protein
MEFLPSLGVIQILIVVNVFFGHVSMMKKSKGDNNEKCHANIDFAHFF